MTSPSPTPSSDALRWGALSAALVLLGCVGAYSQYWAALTWSPVLSALQLLPLAATPAAVALAVATVVQRGVMRERLLVMTLLATAIGPVGYMGRAGLFWIEYTIAGMQVHELTAAVEAYRTRNSTLPPALTVLVPEFLDAVAPTTALVQAGYRNRFGHPAPAVLARYSERGIEVVRSDDCGAWIWRTDAAGDATNCQRDVGATDPRSRPAATVHGDDRVSVGGRQQVDHHRGADFHPTGIEAREHVQEMPTRRHASSVSPQRGGESTSGRLNRAARTRGRARTRA